MKTELKQKAIAMGIRVFQNGNKWLAVYDGTVVASERSESLAYECAIARVEAGVFSKKKS